MLADVVINLIHIYKYVS